MDRSAGKSKLAVMKPSSRTDPWRIFSRAMTWCASGAALCAFVVSCERGRNASQEPPGGDPEARPATGAPDVPAPAPAAHSGDDANAARPLTGLESDHTSAESLSRAVLKALEEKDEDQLTRLRVTYREYSELLFPHFDAAKPPRNIPVEFHWKMLDTKSIVGAREAVQIYGGQEFELLEVLPEGVDEYPTFKLLRKVRLKLRRVSDGKVDTVTIFGSIVEMGSRYKLLSFPS